MFNKLEYGRKWRAKHPEKCREASRKYRSGHLEYYRKQVREWQKNNPDKVKEYKRKFQKNHPEKMMEYVKKYQKNNPEKYEAQQLANHQIPLDSSCLRCGSTEYLERHHPDYDQPLWILTLCHSCHLLIHKLN